MCHVTHFQVYAVNLSIICGDMTHVYACVGGTTQVMHTFSGAILAIITAANCHELFLRALHHSTHQEDAVAACNHIQVMRGGGALPTEVPKVPAEVHKVPAEVPKVPGGQGEKERSISAKTLANKKGKKISQDELKVNAVIEKFKKKKWARCDSRGGADI